MPGSPWEAGAIIISGLISAGIQSAAITDAAEISAGATESGITAQQEQFDAMQAILAPYNAAGLGAIQQQSALTGVLGPEAQQAAISSIENSPQFGAMARQGENAMLQNASATGGLRGGNVQAGMAQFRPQLLSELINQRFGQLGGLAQLGQASAAGVGSAGINTGQGISNLLTNQGNNAANAAISQGNILAGIPGLAMEGIGTLAGSIAPAVPAAPVIAGNNSFGGQTDPAGLFGGLAGGIS